MARDSHWLRFSDWIRISEISVIARQTHSIAPPTPFRYNARMNIPLKITKIGNSAGVILPKEVLAHLNAEVGETLSLVVTPSGIELSSADADFDEQMAAAREVMTKYKRALRELAK